MVQKSKIGYLGAIYLVSEPPAWLHARNSYSSSDAEKKVSSSTLEMAATDFQRGAKEFHMYDFQLDKIIDKARKVGAAHVGLQFPEGFLEYGTHISRTIADAAECDVTIMADAVFGACCIDDLACRSQGIDLLVHFGHSCLVPVDQTVVQTMYIAVTMKYDYEHLISTIKHNFPASTSIALQGTIQFSNYFNEIHDRLTADGYTVQIPRSRPLSAGETLGCTSPEITGADILVFVADGRFHIEAAMMANPDLPAFRYDPFTNRFFSEFLSVNELRKIRVSEMSKCKGGMKRVGLILGTLGRQGSVGVLESIKEMLDEKKIDSFVVLISEISPAKLAQFGDSVDAWIQVACPRLSIDWGESYRVPLLTSFEAFRIWGSDDTVNVDEMHPMDYYSNTAGPWGNYAARKGGWGGSTSWKFWHMGPGKETLAPIS
jgi:2-(3-amino-3-carboxypropyl)histidine synthase